MAKRYSGNYVIRWENKDGTEMRKTYPDYLTVLKAKKWLVDSGAIDIDIAIKVTTEEKQ